eukprot:962977-Pyramimonas_sp.AAC.1
MNARRHINHITANHNRIVNHINHITANHSTKKNANTTPHTNHNATIHAKAKDIRKHVTNNDDTGEKPHPDVLRL